MKIVLAGLLLATALPAYAAPSAPTAAPSVTAESYLATRSRDIAAANREKNPTSDKAQTRALAALEHQLRHLVPPLATAGFKPGGKSNVMTLTHDQEFGQLDGILYTSKDDKTSVLVTTKPLLQAWIKEHADWWPNDVNVPQDLEAALQADVLYTQAISTDAAVDKFADLPVTKPAEAGFAYAMLDIRRQDIARDMPNEIFVALIRGDTVFLASQPVAKPVSPIPACEAVWDKAQAASDAALADYQAHHQGDDKVFDAAQKLMTDGDKAHRRCVAEKLKDQADYKPLVGQAQALVDRLK